MGLSRETAFQFQKDRKKKIPQTAEGWMISQALPRTENQNNA